MGIIISKHLVYGLLSAVKKGLETKTDLVSHTMFLKWRGFVKVSRMFGVPICLFLFVCIQI